MGDEKTVRLTSFEILRLLKLLDDQHGNLNDDLIFKLKSTITTDASVIDGREFDRLTRG